MIMHMKKSDFFISFNGPEGDAGISLDERRYYDFTISCKRCGVVYGLLLYKHVHIVSTPRDMVGCMGLLIVTVSTSTCSVGAVVAASE